MRYVITHHCQSSLGAATKVSYSRLDSMKGECMAKGCFKVPQEKTSRRSFVISPSGRAGGILGTEMPRSKRADKARRAPRVKLAGTILALLRLDNGREVRARLHQLSFTGGLLHLEKPLDEGIKVEVMFHIGESTIRSKGVMLFPMWATQGCLQPFEFSNLEEADRQKLECDLQKLLGSGSNGPSTFVRSAAAGSE